MPSPFIIGKTVVSVENAIFEYKALYKLLQKIFADKGYFIEEKVYSYVPSENRGKLSFFWFCLKDIDDYSRYRIEVDASFNIENITVLKNNQKSESSQGDGKILLRATLITDYDSRWEEGNPILNFLKVIFENVFERSSVVKYLNDLKSELFEIENEIKSYFNIQRMM
jgi:hypothetical protein